MERRLQILLDQERYDRVAHEADVSGRSVAAVIREAIDLRFPSDQERRNAALGRFLAIVPDEGPGESWEDMKKAMDDELELKLT